MTGASDAEAREFAAAFRSFLEWVHSGHAGARERNEVAALVSDFLGEGASGLSVVTRSLPVFEQVNLQTALDAWSQEPGREVLGELRRRLNVYRGHVLEVGLAPMGGVSLEFGEIPLTAREDVVLPEAVLAGVERHALGRARACPH
jgi:hypothetical protein